MDNYYDLRHLQVIINASTTTNITNSAGSNVTDTGKPIQTMGQVAATTLKVYGVIFLALFIIYLLFRPIYIAAYNARGLKETFGRIRWIYHVFLFDEDFMIEQCGLDACSFLRLLRFGLKVSLVGIFNALYLIPVNAMACKLPTEPTTFDITACDTKDYILRSGLGHVFPGSDSLYATMVAAYIFFGSALYFIYQEFEWFTKKRHAFLKKREPENYTVYVSNIPKAYCTDDKLSDYFGSIFSSEEVLETHIALDIPALEKLTMKREKVAQKLEHAINVKNLKGVAPKHRHRPFIGKKVDSIDAFSAELNDLNDSISERIGAIQSRSFKMNGPILNVNETSQYNSEVSDTFVSFHNSSVHVDVPEAMDSKQSIGVSGQIEHEESGEAILTFSENPSKTLPSGALKQDTSMIKSEDHVPLMSSTHTSIWEDNAEAVDVEVARSMTSNYIGDVVEVTEVAPSVLKIPEKTSDSKRSFVHRSMKSLKRGTSSFTNLLFGDIDGRFRSAGFVTFKTLLSTAKCLQMLHHQTPFVFTVADAPQPDDIFWNNVGLTNKKIQLGNLLSQSLTLILCVIWTIPVAFVSSFSKASELEKQLPFLKQWFIKAPWLPSLLTQLQPLFLVILNNIILEFLLKLFCRLEGHISSTKLSVSLFSKLSIFIIFQTFYIQLISGAILKEINTMIKNPLSIVDKLASSIPGQVVNFMQYCMVQTFLGLGLEIIRVIPIVKGFLRKKLGPSLTPKEKSRVWIGLKSIEKYEYWLEFNLPPVLEVLEFSDILSNLMLFFVIIFTYSCLSPAMSFLMCFLFGLLETVYRNQLIYVYSCQNDSGGQLWPNAVKILLVFLFVAEITLVGVLGIKKGLIVAPLCAPILIVTILLMQYLKQQHYHIPHRLPSIECILEDSKNTDADDEFLRGMYLQPALKTKRVEVET